MALNNLADAFYDELCDIFSAEKQLVRALPKMAKNATSPELKEAFEAHLEETKIQVERVEKAFADTGKAARAKKCEAMAGLIEEGMSLIEEEPAEEVLDALLIAAAQKIEHYEIASYGTLSTWAGLLGYDDAKALLDENINEEEMCDKKLTELSEQVNVEAMAEQE